MIPVILASIALPICLVVVVFSCLNCFQKKKPKFQTFQNRFAENAQNNPSFTIDITDAPQEQVSIEPLPDILAKTSSVPPLRPTIRCLDSGKQDATLSLVTIQRSFPREQIQYVNEVGSGWFGKVLDSEASKIVSGSVKSQVMVKMLKDDATKFEQKQFLDEVLAFRCLEHANLVSLLGQCVEATPFLVVLEYAPHGNLKAFLHQHRLEAEAMAKKHRLLNFAVDACAGLACLHTHGYVHNDLAARNCLVMSDYSLKIGDYGISDVLYKDDYMVSGSDLLPIRWMAPESLIKSQGVWTSQPGDKNSDMWSFGVLLWEIFSLGEHPYNELTDEAVLQGVVIDKLIKPAKPDQKLADSDKLWQIMSQCWLEPSERIQVEQCYQLLDHLTSARRDTLEVSTDFEDRWRGLQPNHRASSVDTNLGSRLALAGSFAGSYATSASSSSPPSPTADAVSDFTASGDSKLQFQSSVEVTPDVVVSTSHPGAGDTVVDVGVADGENGKEGTLNSKAEKKEEKLSSLVEPTKIDNVTNSESFIDGGFEVQSLMVTPTKAAANVTPTAVENIVTEPVAVAASTPRASSPKLTTLEADTLATSTVNQESTMSTPVMSTSTPLGLGQTDYSKYFSPMSPSTQGSIYATASEPSSMSDSDFSHGQFDSTNQSFYDVLDATLVQTEAEVSSQDKLKPEVADDSVVKSNPDTSFTSFESALSISGDFDIVGQNKDSVKISSTVDENAKSSSDKAGDGLDFLHVASENQVMGLETAAELMTSDHLTNEFESLNLASSDKDQVQGEIVQNVQEVDQVVDNKASDFLGIGSASESNDNEMPAKTEENKEGPLMDEDVDQLLEMSSSEQPQAPTSEILSVQSLPSNPSGLSLEEAVHTDSPQPPVQSPASGFGDILEPLSFGGDLLSLPVQPSSSDLLGEEGKEDILAALTETPLDSQLSIDTGASEQGVVNLLEDAASQPLGSEKVGTTTTYSLESESSMDVIGTCCHEDGDEYHMPSDVLSNEDCPKGMQLKTGLVIIDRTDFTHHQNSLSKLSFQEDCDRLNKENLESGSIGLLHSAKPLIESDVCYQENIKEESNTTKHGYASSVISQHPDQLLAMSQNKEHNNSVIETTAVNNKSHQTEKTKVGDGIELVISPDEDVTTDSGVHSGKQGKLSDSESDYNDDEGDGGEASEDLAGTDSPGSVLSPPDSPSSKPSPPDSDTEVSSTGSGTTSTSGSSGCEYSCDTGQQIQQSLSPDTGQTASTPIDTGQSRPKCGGPPINPNLFADGAEENSKEECGMTENEEETLQMITDHYMSKGVKSPRTFAAQRLETIHENETLTSSPLRRQSSLRTLSDTSSLEVRYEDLFGTDGFEWDDDFYEDDEMSESTDTLRGRPSSPVNDSETLRARPSSPVKSETSEQPLMPATTLSSTREALNQILSRTGLLKHTGSDSSDKNILSKDFNSITQRPDPAPSLPLSSSHKQPSSFSMLSSTLNHSPKLRLKHLNQRLGENHNSMYSLAEDFSFDSDSLSELAEFSDSSPEIMDAEDDSLSKNFVFHNDEVTTSIQQINSLQSHLGLPSDPLNSEPPPSTCDIINSKHQHSNEIPAPDRQDLMTRLTHDTKEEAPSTNSSSMGEWDLLGLDATTSLVSMSESKGSNDLFGLETTGPASANDENVSSDFLGLDMSTGTALTNYENGSSDFLGLDTTTGPNLLPTSNDNSDLFGLESATVPVSSPETNVSSDLLGLNTPTSPLTSEANDTSDTVAVNAQPTLIDLL